MRKQAKQKEQERKALYHVIAPNGAFLTSMRATPKDITFEVLDWLKANGRVRCTVRKINEN